MAMKNNLSTEALKSLCKYICIVAQQGSIINDTLQSEDKSFSSKHITDLINSMSEQDRKYANDLVANLNKLSSKTTSVIPDSSNAEPNTLYLYSADPNPTSYNQYMVLSDKTILDLGTTNISLDGYLKETDADSKYLKQVDAHSHSNKSTIDNLTQNVIDNINNLNIEVGGVSYTQDVDGKIALPNYPTIPNIANTLTSTSTNDEVAGALAVYNSAIKDKNLKSFIFLSQLGLEAGCTVEDVFNAIPAGCIAIINVTSSNVVNVPQPHGVLIIIKHASRHSLLFKVSGTDSVLANNLYIGQLKGSDGTGLVWNKVISDGDLVTTIDSTSTDTQIPSAKSVYDKFNNMLILDYATSDTMNVNFNKTGFYKFNAPTKGVPENNVGDYMLLNIPWNNCYPRNGMYAYQLLFSPRCSGFWTRVVWNYNPNTYVYTEGDYSVFTKWKTVGYVQHAAKEIEFDSETNYKPASVAKLKYVVTNNVCYVTGGVDCVTPLSELTVCTNIPEAYMAIYVKGMNINGKEDEDPAKIFINGSNLQLRRGVAGNSYRFSFSYPLTKNS